MKTYIINGGNKLEGIVEISGSKNSALPILASTILCGRDYIIKNVPDIDDVKMMLEILILLGCSAYYEDGSCYINTKNLNTYDISDKLSKKLRSSIIFLGPMLARSKKAKITFPGGCDIGSRPIDLHLNGLKELGVDIIEDGDFILCSSINTNSCDINLRYPSVGATENLMLFALSVEGKTRILNAAKEPEIVDLQNFLVKCGYSIEGAGTDTITVFGLKNTNKNIQCDESVEYNIISDRIEASTFIALAASTNSRICIKNADKRNLTGIIKLYREAGCLIDDLENYIYIVKKDRIKSIGRISSSPYPGFPTDMQAQLMSSLCCSDGVSYIEENVFENRFKHVNELNKMGANIVTLDNIAVITGVKKLHAADVNVRDLRGGAALVLAALSAEGTSVVNNVEHIHRGYENFASKLLNLGADIREI